MTHAAPEGAGRYDRLHGDEDQVLDVEAFTAKALEDVVETIMLFGQYPQPRHNAHTIADHRPVRFDLQEYLVDNLDPSDLANLAMNALTNHSPEWDERRLNAERDLEKELTEHLRDSEIVRDRAEELAQEDYDDHRED